VSTAQAMFRLVKEAVKTYLSAVDGVLVNWNCLKIPLMQLYCRERLSVEYGAESAESAPQLCTKSS